MGPLQFRLLSGSFVLSTTDRPIHHASDSGRQERQTFLESVGDDAMDFSFESYTKYGMFSLDASSSFILCAEAVA